MVFDAVVPARWRPPAAVGSAATRSRSAEQGPGVPAAARWAAGRRERLRSRSVSPAAEQSAELEAAAAAGLVRELCRLAAAAEELCGAGRRSSRRPRDALRGAARAPHPLSELLPLAEAELQGLHALLSAARRGGLPAADCAEAAQHSAAVDEAAAAAAAAEARRAAAEAQARGALLAAERDCAAAA
eukprot:TRINITY_DN17819_c0_g3_i3.p3 TRINITY_DN17819_c0_g3~~TRINITY_DN17819_c0_g3_i3.p3  ORF type:complete len:187 (+),score=57.26 TRINITY_DN17819_c0_g3_i3:103-663(+)